MKRKERCEMKIKQKVTFGIKNDVLLVLEHDFVEL